jgi:hypothetical protein
MGTLRIEVKVLLLETTRVLDSVTIRVSCQTVIVHCTKLIKHKIRARGSVVEALCYKPEGRAFNLL